MRGRTTGEKPKRTEKGVKAVRWNRRPGRRATEPTEEESTPLPAFPPDRLSPLLPACSTPPPSTPRPPPPRPGQRVAALVGVQCRERLRAAARARICRHPERSRADRRLPPLQVPRLGSLCGAPPRPDGDPGCHEVPGDV